MRARSVLLPTLATLALAACVVDGATGTPPVVPVPVVHAILDPGRAEQVILLERTITGRPTMPAAFDSLDPIVSSGGVPISGARVVLRDEHGDSVVAVEDVAARGDGRGAGVYRVANSALGGGAGLAILPGGRYFLRIATSLGDVHGETRVPFEDPDNVQRTPIAHDLAMEPRWELLGSRDERRGIMNHIALSSDPGRAVVGDVPGIALGVGAQTMFTQAREGFTVRQTALFDPCRARHEVRFTALDSNYYAHLTTDADDDLLGDRPRRTGVTGGRGVFGATVTFLRREVRVSSSLVAPFEGEWELTGGPAVLGATVCLYAEFEPPDGSFTNLSGVARSPLGVLVRLVGRRTGDSLIVVAPEERMLGPYDRPAHWFDLRQRGDTLTGTVGVEGPGTTSVRLVRRGPLALAREPALYRSSPPPTGALPASPRGHAAPTVVPATGSTR